MPDPSRLPLPALRDAYPGHRWTLVWDLAPDASTWRLDPPDAGGETLFAKIAAAGRYPSIPDESARLRWAGHHLPVPAVRAAGSADGWEWMVTAALPGRDATDARLRSDPRTLVPSLARALRRFHADAPLQACPFDFRLEASLRHVRERHAAGLIRPGHLHPEHEHLGVDGALAELERLRPAAADLVVCHGDYCLPNVLFHGEDAGGVPRLSGFLDLGELSVADRWWDLAVGAWSVTWNLGPGWEDLFLSSYGVEPDPQRIRFYRLLYDLAS